MMEELPIHIGFPLIQPGAKPFGQSNVKPGQQLAFEFEQNG